MSAQVWIFRQPIRLSNGDIQVTYSAFARCEHGGAGVPLSAAMFEDARFRASFTRLEQDLRRGTGCTCTASIPADAEVVECHEVAAQ